MVLHTVMTRINNTTGFDLYTFVMRGLFNLDLWI